MSYIPNNRSIDDMKLWSVKRFDVKAGQKCCYIRSCAILPNKQLIFADENNQRLVVVGTDGKHVCDMIVSQRPFDIEPIDSAKIAVSYGIAKYIEVINIEDKKVESRMELKGFCSGLTLVNGKLLVLVNGHGIQEIDLTIKTVTSLELPVKQSFVITSGGERLYCADLQSNSLCCYMSGILVWRLTSPLLHISQAISADEYGNVFLTETDTNQIVAISFDGANTRKLLDDKQGINLPSAVYYDKSTKHLLVCNRENGRAFLYSLM